jgi:uncharacterized membrane protein YeiH
MLPDRPDSGPTVLAFIELTAVISCGLFGVILARQKRMDLVGVYAIALGVGIVLFRLAALHWDLRLPEANPTDP